MQILGGGELELGGDIPLPPHTHTLTPLEKCPTIAFGAVSLLLAITPSMCVVLSTSFRLILDARCSTPATVAPLCDVP